MSWTKKNMKVTAPALNKRENDYHNSDSHLVSWHKHQVSRGNQIISALSTSPALVAQVSFLWSLSLLPLFIFCSYWPLCFLPYCLKADFLPLLSSLFACSNIIFLWSSPNALLFALLQSLFWFLFLLPLSQAFCPCSLPCKLFLLVFLVSFSLQLSYLSPFHFPLLSCWIFL